MSAFAFIIVNYYSLHICDQLLCYNQFYFHIVFSRIKTFYIHIVFVHLSYLHVLSFRTFVCWDHYIVRYIAKRAPLYRYQVTSFHYHIGSLIISTPVASLFQYSPSVNLQSLSFIFINACYVQCLITDRDRSCM